MPNEGMKNILYILLIPVMFWGMRPSKPYTKLAIYPRIIRDLQDFSKSDGDSGKVWNFFNLRGVVDPGNGVTTVPGGTDAFPGWPINLNDQWFPQGTVQGVYWPGNRGCRVVFDMTGAKDLLDTNNRVTLTDIYGWEEANIDAGDTMWFYNLDVMFRVPPAQRCWFLARPDSLLTPFAVLVTTNHFAGQWLSASFSVTCRYVMVRVVKKNRVTYSTKGDFRELAFYGTYGYDTNTIARRPDTYTEALPAGATYGQRSGSNFIAGIDTAETVYEGNLRYFGFTNYWDATAGQTTTASMTPTLDHFSDIGPTQYAAYKRHNQTMWWSIRGTSAYMQSIHPGAAVNIDSFYLDPEGPPSQYTRDAKLYGWYAGQWYGTINQVENDNECNYYLTAQAYLQRSKADYDSMQVHAPGMKLIMAGTTDIDTLWSDNLVWECTVFGYNWFFSTAANWHHYTRNIGIIGHQPTYDQQIGAHAVSPESENGVGVYTLLNKGVRAVYNYLNGDTSKQVWLTEYGNNGWGSPSTTLAQAQTNWATQCVYPRGSWDSLQYGAIFETRAELIYAATGVSCFTRFCYSTSNLSCTLTSDIFQSCAVTCGNNGGVAPFKSDQKYPKYYYRAGVYGRLKWYKLVSFSGLTDTTGYAHELWVKIDSATGQMTDSICDIVWKTTQTASSFGATNVSLNGYRRNSQVQQVVPSFTSVNGTATTLSTSNGTLPLTGIDERATMYFSRQLSFPQFWQGGHRIFTTIN